MVSEANLDQAAERRRVREAFKDVQLGIDHCLFKVILDLFMGWVCFGFLGLILNNNLLQLTCFSFHFGEKYLFFVVAKM